MARKLQGVGYVEKGLKVSETHQYSTWSGMIMRCYDEKYQNKFPTYKGCAVSDEWLNFKNFASWYSENYYEIDGEQMDLDKDILIKGNKIYSPENCVFVPHSINMLFNKKKAKRGKYPIGVNFDTAMQKYKARCSLGNGKKKHIGYYYTPEEAFYAYKLFKENYIKEKAEKYKSSIPEKLYKAMLNYEVEIND